MTTNSSTQGAEHLITAKDFYHLRRLEEPRLSPDGSRVAYVLVTVDQANNSYRSAVWVAATAGGPGKPFTAGEKRDTSPRWSPDGSRLVFVSNRHGDKNQIYLIDLDGGEARRLTNMENGATAAAWSPDGRRLAFLSPVNAEERAAEAAGEPREQLDADERQRRAEEKKKADEKKCDPRLIERLPYRAGTNFLSDRYSHVYLIDVDAGDTRPQRVTDGDYDFAPPAWLTTGDAEEAALVTWAVRDPQAHDLNFNGQVLRLSVSGGEPLVLSQPGYHPQSPWPSPDGRWVAYIHLLDERPFSQTARLAVVPAGGGPAIELTGDLDAPVGEFCWSSDSQWLYFTAAVHGNNGVYRVRPHGGPVEPVIGGVRYVTGLDAGTDHLVCAISEPGTLADLFVFDATGQGERRLTEINASFLAGKTLALTEEMWYESHDGTPIQGWIVKPPDFDPTQTYPLVLEIHGGPHAMWGPAEPSMWHEFQVLAARGYVVFYCNPRASSGYGHAFRTATHAHWGFADQQDYLIGLELVIRRGYVDPERLAVTGGSYGGYMTAWLIGHDDRFKAAVSQRGVYNLISFTGTTDIPRFTESQYGASYWDDPLLLWQHSPLAYVEQIHTPLLIVHSEHDYRAPISDAEQLYTALKRLGREVVLVRYPREGHELSRSGEPKHRIDRINRIVAWFDEHVGAQTG
ncbi:MAG: S9 family peptidase [Chloroflexota bacterium]